jgi:hypothetical protein
MCIYDFIGASYIRNIPLSSCSKKTFINNVLLQGDKLYLKAINSGFIMLDPGIDFLCVEHLPKVIRVSSSCTNMSNDFLFETCLIFNGQHNTFL